MRVTLRLLAALWLSTLLILGGFAFFQVREERQRLVDDLQRRSALLSEGLKEASVLRTGSPPAVARLLKRFARPDRRLAVYDRFAGLVASAPDPAPAASIPEITDAISRGAVAKGLRTIGGKPTYVYATPIQHEEQTTGALVVMVDATPLDEADIGLWQYNAVRFFAVALGISLITFVTVRISITRPIAELTEWTKSLKIGKAPPTQMPAPHLFGPLGMEVVGLAQNLHRARVSAEREAALRLTGETIWTEERLKQFVRLRLGTRPVFVVSNREPVSHVWRGGSVVPIIPASGVVTALEPVMRACGGVWVAHGSGDADRQAVDARNHVAVPVDDPRYTLRRVWLSKEEEDGYYYGFANEGLWPLCHIVHARPLFRQEDWSQYRAVNTRFADALLEELEGADAPVVLVQDYHFALLAALVKAARPDASVGIFWHIPWPNPEAFGICPWQQDILQGMLAADLVGFHTQYHCNNFLESVERTLEARIDWPHFTVTRGRHTARVRPFPISVAADFVDGPPDGSREALLAELEVQAEFLGVGVDRVDYTKGLPERFRAIQRFFERYPHYRERLVFVQLAAPSRSRIARYQQLQAEVDATVAEVNQAVGTKRWRPIVYLNRHRDHREIFPFYRHADFCMVTSLHDGMNLVAKEFVSVRADGEAALILSRFTGAARELSDALIVNPYDVDETAEAIRQAIEMAPEERRARMTRMSQQVREQNVYRWAGLLLSELAGLATEPVAAEAS